MLHLGGKKYLTLADSSGKLSANGRYFFSKSGKEPPKSGFDPNTQVIKRGPSEFIRMLNGEERQIRRWDAGKSDFNYTQLGREYYKKERIEVMVGIPVSIRGTNKKSNLSYTRSGQLWHSTLGIDVKVPKALNRLERDKHIKAEVKKQLPPTGSIFEDSDEQYFLAEGGEWSVSTLTTQPGEGGQPVVEAVIDRPLRSATPFVYEFLPYREGIMPEAYEASNNCVCHQLAAQTEMDLAKIEEDMDSVFDALPKANKESYGGLGWREVGVSSRMLLAWAEKRQVKCSILWGKDLIQTYVPPTRPALDKRIKPIAACVWGDHIHCYGSTAAKMAVGHLQPSKCPVFQVSKMRMMREALEEKCPSFEPLPEGMLPEKGNYVCEHDEIRQVLSRFLGERKVPAVRKVDFEKIAALQFDGLTVRAQPEHFHQLQDFCSALSAYSPIRMSYRGTGLANTTLTAIIRLLRPRRQYVQENKVAICAQCGEQAKCERDHVTPLSHGGVETQMLCPGCHQEKTRNEALCLSHERGESRNPLMSHFEPTVWRDFIEAHSPLAYVQEVHAPVTSQKVLSVDVKRCRATALLESEWDFPVFCAQDSITRTVQGELADFMYVERANATIWDMPYTGSGWYHRCTVEWMLQRRIINWSHIQYSLQASNHLPKDCFQVPFGHITQAWKRTGVYDSPTTEKQALNSAIGLMGRRESYIYNTILTNCQGDAVRMGGEVSKKVLEEGLLEYTSRTKLIESWTMLPFYFFCLDFERLRVAQICEIIRKQAPQRGLLHLKTDGIQWECRHRKALKEVLETVSYKDLSVTGANENKAACLRVEICKSTPPPPNGYSNLVEEPLPRINFAWERYRETPESDVEAVCREILDRGESLCILGSAGTGKTHLALRLIEYLRGKKEHVAAVAKTHVAARNICGKTLQHFVYRHVLNGSFKGTLVVDEIGCVEQGLWNSINALLVAGVRFILLGDFCQLEPISNTPSATSFEDSRLFHSLSSGNRVELTQYRRGADRVLFDWYTSLNPGGLRAGLDIKELVTMAKKAFPRSQGFARWNLCLSHRRRVELNRLINRYECRDPELTWTPPEEDENDETDLNKPQAMLISKGTPLIGHLTDAKLGIMHGGFYEVERASHEGVLMRDIETDASILLPVSKLRYVRLGMCITYNSVQGRTLKNGIVRLFDTGHQHFTWRHLGVGLSRAVSLEQVEIAA